MNGFADHGLDEDAFGEKGSNIVQAFDYFRTYSAPSEQLSLLRSLSYPHSNHSHN